ncbi:hypothetical protein JHK85_034729 [Glycine max]|nr:hypothetical protein JHK85_034729 [Glycine max]
MEKVDNGANTSDKPMPAAKNLKELGTLEPSTDPRECTKCVLLFLANDNYYKSSNVIRCKDGSGKFTKAQLNDDFCECADGIDELGMWLLWNSVPWPFCCYLKRVTQNALCCGVVRYRVKDGDGVPRGSLGDPRRQHKVPISGHDSTSLVHPDEPARTLQHTVEWILPTPTPYRLVEPVHVIEVTSSEEDPEEDPEELPPEPAVDALDFLEGDEDPLSEVDSPEDVMSASEADSTEDSGPGEMAIRNFNGDCTEKCTGSSTPHKAPTFGAHFYSKSRKEGIFGVVKCVATSGTSKFQIVLFECCFAWMLWKLERIDGDPVLRETRIWATWEYVSSDGGGQQGMWYLEICRGGQETLGTSGGVLLPKTKLDQSRPNPGIVGQ